MATPQLQLPSGELNRSPEGPEDGQFVGRHDLPMGQPAHFESVLPLALARRVVEEALSLARPVRCRLTVEGKGGSVSIDLPLKFEPEAAPDFRLRTPDGMQGVEFVLNARPGGQATLSINVRYAGQPVGRALSYARFLYALYGEGGTLYLTRLEPEELRLKLLELPLPLDPNRKVETEGMLRFLEALDEISRTTDTEVLYPSQVEDEDLSNVNHVLKAIRSGWVALHVTDFTTPLGPDGVKNVLDLVAQEGEVARAFAMTSQGELYKIFDSWVNLGPSTRYVSAARLQSSRTEMEEWLASERGEDDSFEVRWTPEDGALIHVFYQEWPKPSLDMVRRNLEAFETEYGMSSDEFRRAWDNEEPRARDIEDGDIWLSFLEAREALKGGA
jgi:hypothetical protein